MENRLIEQARYDEALCHFPEHSHSSHELLYVKEGSLELRIGNRVCQGRGPCLVFFAKTEPHAVKILSDRYCRYSVCISPQLASGAVRSYTLLSLLANRPSHFEHVLPLGEHAAEIEAVFCDLLAEFCNESSFSEELQAANFNRLLISIYRIKPSLFSLETEKSISIIWQIQQELELHYAEPFSLDALATRHHISRCYLSHLFKKITGLSPMQYVVMCRLSAARELLATTDKSITEILHEVGFSDSSNFSRSFREKLGLTPQEYRNQAKNRITTPLPLSLPQHRSATDNHRRT